MVKNRTHNRFSLNPVFYLAYLIIIYFTEVLIICLFSYWIYLAVDLRTSRSLNHGVSEVQRRGTKNPVDPHREVGWQILGVI